MVSDLSCGRRHCRPSEIWTWKQIASGMSSSREVILQWRTRPAYLSKARRSFERIPPRIYGSYLIQNQIIQARMNIQAHRVTIKSESRQKFKQRCHIVHLCPQKIERNRGKRFVRQCKSIKCFFLQRNRRAEMPTNFANNLWNSQSPCGARHCISV